MTTIALTEQNFQQTIEGADIVLIDFWAAWCGPCRQFAPVYDEVSSAHPDITFAKVDTEAEQSLAAAADITSIPTIMILRSGIPVFAQAGALPKDALEDVIAQARALDMDDIRAQLDQAQRGGVTGQPHTHATSGSGRDATAEQAPAPQRGDVPGVDFPDANGAIV